jgi:hypothetical protein
MRRFAALSAFSDIYDILVVRYQGSTFSLGKNLSKCVILKTEFGVRSMIRETLMEREFDNQK